MEGTVYEAVARGVTELLGRHVTEPVNDVDELFATLVTSVPRLKSPVHPIPAVEAALRNYASR